MSVTHDQTAELWIRKAEEKWNPEDLEIIVALAEAIAEAQGRPKLYIHELHQAERQYMKEGHIPLKK